MRLVIPLIATLSLLTACVNSEKPSPRSSVQLVSDVASGVGHYPKFYGTISITTAPVLGDSREFHIVCLDGIEYWYTREGFAPRFEVNQLSPSHCK